MELFTSKRPVVLGVLSLALTFIQFTVVRSADAQMPQDRPALASLSEQTRTLVLTWLNRDCGANAKRVLEDQLQAIGTVLEPVFWEAYRLGPLPANLERDQDNMRQRYDQRQAWLKENGGKLFGAQNTTRLMQIPREQYVKKEMANLITGYKTAAILGLGLVGTQTSLPELERIANDADDPASTAAKQTITNMQTRNQ